MSLQAPCNDVVVKDDPLRLDLLDELRALRKGPGPFEVDRLALSPTIIELVGRDSLEQAHAELLDLLHRQGRDPDGDVRAYFETIGHELGGQNLTERLTAYADRHHVEQRTALRRSDRGAERVSYVLRDRFNYERPWGEVIVVQDGNFAEVSVSVNLPFRSRWRRPIVYINEVLQDRREFELHESGISESFISGVELFHEQTLNLDADAIENEPLLNVRVVWIPGVWPTWQTGVQLTDTRLYAKMVNGRDYSAEVSIHWAGARAAAVRERPFAQFDPTYSLPR